MVKIKSRLQTFLGMVTKVIVARIASSLVRVQVEQLKRVIGLTYVEWWKNLDLIKDSRKQG